MLCSVAEIARVGRQDFWIHDSDLQQNWSGNEKSLREVGELVWRQPAYSSLSRKQHFQILLESRSPIHRNQQCECGIVGSYSIIYTNSRETSVAEQCARKSNDKHMANVLVEVAVREVERQCRTLRISAEHNTCVRVADDSPLLSWLPRSANGATWGENWFRKIGEGGVSSFASLMARGIFVGHHDRTGAVLCSTKNGFVPSKSWTRQNIERCLGIDELGWLVRHCVANGGSGIEVDEESHSR